MTLTGGNDHGPLLPDADLDLAGLPDLVGYAVRRAQIAMFQDFYRTLSPIGLTPAAFSVLLLIGRNPGARQRQVSDVLGIQASNFAVLAAQLAARGLVERRPNAMDRRSVALHLSGDGERLLGEATTLVQQHDRAFTARLSEQDRAGLLAMLKTITPED